MRQPVRYLRSIIVASTFFQMCASALAHPHVWITSSTTVLYDNGRIAGFRHRWIFDDMYTAMATAGLDANGDGIYTRAELEDLAQTNIDGLSEFAYFTFAKLGDRQLPLAAPRDYWLEYEHEKLSLHFTLPLKQPVLAEAEGFSFTVVDESFYIAFELDKEAPIVLGGESPSGCVVNVTVPEQDLAELQQLNAAFAGAMTAGDANIGVGASYAQTIFISCPRR